MSAGPTVPSLAGDADDLASGVPEPSGPADPSTGRSADGLPDDAAALSSDWGSSRRRRTTGMGPRLGPVGWLRWGWRQLTSMRTALVLLFLLALAAIPGSVLPQRASDPIAVTTWLSDNPGIGPVLDRVRMFDVFSAPWFTAIYVLLFISLIGCVLPRIGGHARAMRQPTPPAPRRLDRLPGATTWRTEDADVLDRAAATLRTRHWRITREDTLGPAGSLAAERGLARETGNLLFHLALVLILLGVAAGSLLGWKGSVIVREGTGFSNTLTQYDEFSPGRLTSAAKLPPFSFTLSSFAVTFQRDGSQRGAPRSFEAELQYTSAPGQPAEKRTVSVNSPLRVDGAKVYLVGHGYAPHLRLTDSKGRVVFDDTVVFLPQDGNFTSTGVVKSPDADPSLAIDAIFAPTATITDATGPISTFPAPDNPGLFASAWTGDLGLDSGTPQNVFRLETHGLTRLGIEALSPGQTWTLPNGQGTVEFVDVQRWASFRIAYDPGRWLALAGGLLALVGLSMSLFVRRRRIWVRVSEVSDAPVVPDRGSTVSDHPRTVHRVQVAGLSRTGSADVIGEVHELVVGLGGPAKKEGS